MRIWHGAWRGALALVVGGVMAGRGAAALPVAEALAAAAFPAIVVLILGGRIGRRGRSLVLVLWAVAGGVACGLTGGVSGPFAVFCLAPMAAATLLGSSRLLAQAAALAVMAAALAALAQFARLCPVPPDEPLRSWLGLVALSVLGVAFAGGLSLARRRGEGQGATAQADHDRMERLLSDQPYLLAALDGQGTVLAAYGYCPPGLADEVLRQQGLIEAVAPVDRQIVAQALNEALEEGRAEASFRPAAWPERHIRLSLRHSEDGRLAGVLHDLTAQKERETLLEAARAEAEAANGGKSRFLANMSHELRTPLNTIMGFSDAMRSKLFGPLPAKYVEYADLIHESGKHLLDLINDVLDMSKIEAQRFQLNIEGFDAREPVFSALRLMRVQADDSGVAMRAVLPAEPLRIEADSRALKQIVLNLVSNALKFTPRGGQVTVTVTTLAEALELTVADTGMGIAAEDLKRLGRPFQQAGDASQRAQGTGLGLSLVRAFAELHGGRMSIQSALGQGTTVTVRIPGLRQTAQAAQGAKAESRPTAKVIAFNPKVG